MDRIRIGNLCGGQQLGNVQIGIRGTRGSDAHRLVCKAHMEAVPVRGGINRHGLDPHFLAGTDDAKGDFAAVGYQYFLKHNV
jgi:hypothetical protein